MPNVGPYIYDVSISGFTRSSIYIYEISSLRVKEAVLVPCDVFGFIKAQRIRALFKALLFVCAGCVIHSIGDSQDIRFICGLSVYIPFTSSSLMVSNFALCGIPFFGWILF